MTKNVQTTRKKTEEKTSAINMRLIWWILGGVVGLALIVWMAASIASETEIDPSVAFGEVTVQGDVLPTFTDPATDPAVGSTAPTVSGADWDGNNYSIAPDGQSKIVVFLAHWCPHCQAEVPRIQAWIEEGGLPDDVEMYSMTVLSDPNRTDFPPQEWLESEGWSVPVIMDDQIGTGGTAYGLRGTPFYVVLDGDNNTLGRFAGEVGVDGLNAMVQLAQTG